MKCYQVESFLNLKNKHNSVVEKTYNIWEEKTLTSGSRPLICLDSREFERDRDRDRKREVDGQADLGQLQNILV